MKMHFRRVCLFWGAMDILYLAIYIGQNIIQRRIPFLADINNFRALYSEHGEGVWLMVVFILSMILTLSIVFSAALLLVAWGKVCYLVAAQTPLRLLLVVPSLSFLPWLVQYIHSGGVAVALILLLMSEALKVGSLMVAKKHNK